MSKKVFKKVRSVALAISMVAFLGCGKDTPATSEFYNPNDAFKYNPSDEPSNLSKSAVDGVRPKVVIKNMFYRVHKEVGAQIEDLFGELASVNPSHPVNFDNVTSFNVVVHQGKLTLDSKNMNNLMKYFVLNYPEAPLSEMEQTIEAGNRLTIKGKMKQAGIKVSFEMSGSIRATPDGLMMLTPDSIKTIGLPSKGLLDFLGIETQGLINLNEQRGMKIVGNSIIMYPGKMFPPPAMQGRVSRVETEPDKLIIYFDDNTKLSRPPLPINDPEIKNYQHVYGGAVRLIGNETHENANLLMVDMDQSNIFDFSIGEYYNHTIAGVVNAINRSGTLVTYMPDYNDIPKRLNRKILFPKVDSNMGQPMKQNPQSNPMFDKQKGWASQPSTMNVNR